MPSTNMKVTTFYSRLFVLFLSFFSTDGLRYNSLWKIRAVSASRISLLSMKMVDDENGYDPSGSLTRQGLVPYFIRIVNPSTYDSAVSKYMKLEKCSKTEAMANMDAYFADPNGWAARKIKERKGLVPKLDYVNANQDKTGLLLTLSWSILIAGILLRILQVQTGL